MSGLTAKAPRTLLSILAALGLLAALTMPAIAGVEVDWATVTGYADGTSENNHPETWGENCADAGVKGQDTWVLPALPEGQVYSLVVVKAGSDQSAEEPNTLFANPSAGQTVWADSDGSGDFSEGDKGISHIIVCTDEEEPPPPPTASLFAVPCDPTAGGPSLIQIEAAALEGLRLFLAPEGTDDFVEQLFDGNGVLEVEPGTYEWVITEADGTTELGSGTVDVEECGITVNPPPPDDGESGATPPQNEGELGGTPTMAPQSGSIPDTAMGQFDQVPATVLSLVLIGALAAMVYVRLARQR